MGNFLFWKSILLILLVVFTSKADKDDSEEVACPSECICETAPLRTAPFVLTWMTSWGEDSLPEVHKNDILNPALMASSGTAKDAGIDVDKIGLHVTCSLHYTSNTTTLLSSIPPKTMVLTLLQAPGCNFTIIDGGQLVNLNSLIGLHIQGYAYEDKMQVSGYTPNKIPEVVSQQRILNNKMNDDPASSRELTIALAEDALKSLLDLQLIDLQYVRLVASKDIRRLRRYSMDPISSRTLLDLPLPNFLQAAREVEDFQLPPYLEEYESFVEWYDTDDDSMESNIFPIDQNLVYDGKNAILEELTGDIPDKDKVLLKYINANDIDNVIPYMVFRTNFKRKLAPFTELKNVKYLRIAHGQLDKIGSELFDGLHKLHTLTLEYNFIQVIPDNIFTSVSALRHLSLAHNKILSADFKSLQGLSQLLTVDLDFNRIQVIGTKSFPFLPLLKTIRAIGNPIIQIFPDAFISVNNTENIYLGSTMESMDIHEDSFRSLPYLDTLVLQNVSKSNLKRNLFSGIPNIKHIALHGQISEIEFDAFSKISQLKELDLSHCNLEKLSMDSFFGLHNLIKLDLSYNKLTDIAPGTFDYLISLKELYMNDNRLTTLPLGIFLPVPAKLIRLERNPWDCTCDLLQLRPSITNKVKRPGPVVCRWSDKLATVCRKTRDRLVYDARVAPLCVTPLKLNGNDVYHAALRHLKCSKYHWDPRLLSLGESRKQTKQIIIKSKNKKPGRIFDQKAPVRNGWIPLSDHTPTPLNEKDLLVIAETEDLDEVEEISRKESQTVGNISFVDENPQKDEAESFQNNRFSVYQSKEKIKEMRPFLLDTFKKVMLDREEEKQAIKRDYKHKMYQKAKLKAFIKKKQRESYTTNKKLKNFFI